jgi:hypothetical protein
MVNSQNGWLVLDSDTSGPQPHLRKWVVPGTKRHLLLRDGSAGFLLVHMATWFDDVIEDLDNEKTWDDWGWAPRPVRGGSTPSNHASGTAMDLNATKHPMGVATSKTFSPAEIAKIHERLSWFRGCIRWGGDYQNRPDAMHFEINKPMASVQARARTLTKTPRGKEITRANRGAWTVIFS